GVGRHGRRCTGRARRRASPARGNRQSDGPACRRRLPPVTTTPSDSRSAERIKVATPAKLIVGPLVLVLGALAVSGGGALGPMLILGGVMLTIVGWVARQRRIRDEYNFRIQLLLHEANDQD